MSPEYFRLPSSISRKKLAGNTAPICDRDKIATFFSKDAAGSEQATDSKDYWPTKRGSAQKKNRDDSKKTWKKWINFLIGTTKRTRDIVLKYG